MQHREPRDDVRFEPKYCAFLRQYVWAMLTQSPSGDWRIVNCLDKDEPCFSLNCAFTAPEGEWPYKSSSAAPADTVNVISREWPHPRGGRREGAA